MSCCTNWKLYHLALIIIFHPSIFYAVNTQVCQSVYLSTFEIATDTVFSHITLKTFYLFTFLCLWQFQVNKREFLSYLRLIPSLSKKLSRTFKFTLTTNFFFISLFFWHSPMLIKQGELLCARHVQHHYRAKGKVGGGLPPVQKLFCPIPCYKSVAYRKSFSSLNFGVKFQPNSSAKQWFLRII